MILALDVGVHDEMGDHIRYIYILFRVSLNYFLLRRSLLLDFYYMKNQNVILKEDDMDELGDMYYIDIHDRDHDDRDDRDDYNDLKKP